MKSGELVICLVDADRDPLAGTYFYRKGNHYSIDDIFDNSIYINSEDGSSYYFYIRQKPYNNDFLFSDYFMTLMEYRKLKLEKLNHHVI